MPHNSKSTQILWNFPCASSKPHHKALLGCGVAKADRCGKSRPSPIAANCSSDNSRHGLLTKWWIMHSSQIHEWQDKLTCIKSQKFVSSIYTPCKINVEDGVVVVAFSLLVRIFGRVFNHSFPGCAFFFFEVEISLRTLIPLFEPGSVHSGTAS